MSGVLRDYQIEMLDRLYDAWGKHRSVMVQMPTGTGKTYVLAEVIRREMKNGKGESGNVLVVAHRRELLEQIRNTLGRFGLNTSLADGTNASSIVVESIQKLAREGCPIPNPSPQRGGECLMGLSPSLVVIDEAHHALARTYRMLWEWWPKARFLGLTATPCRLSGEPFTDLFDVLLQSWTIRKFIEEKRLSNLDYVSVRPNSTTMQMVASLDKRGSDGDYQTKQMANVLDVPESVEHLYRCYKKYAEGKKGIVYAINREHARHIAEYYSENGVRCAVIDAKTPEKERERLVAMYRQVALRGLDVLVNVDIFSEGFDVPEVEFVQLARPTLSLSKYMQQLGRGMRVTKSKRDVIILDQVGLYLIFGLPKNNRDWQGMFLGKVKGRGKVPANSQRLMCEVVDEKDLLNEELYRIEEYVLRDGVLYKKNKEKAESRSAERYGRLQIFRERGLYGVRSGGIVTCPPAFERIERIGQKGGNYFAKGVLPNGKAGVEEFTIIDKDGKDLHARMKGRLVAENDGLFEYQASESGRLASYIWDARYDRYYKDVRVVSFMGITLFKNGMREGYTLRGCHERIGLLDMTEVLFNDRMVIMGRDLFVKDTPIRHYHIEGFHDDSIWVTTADGVARVSKDGSIGMASKSLPRGLADTPRMRLLELHRAGGMTCQETAMRALRREMLGAFGRKANVSDQPLLLQVPMGAGKLRMAVQIIKDSIWKNGGVKIQHVVVVAHRKETKTQIAAVLDSFKVGYEVLTRIKSDALDYEDVTVIHTEQIKAFVNRNAPWFTPVLIVIDEAHRIDKASFLLLRQRWPHAQIVGLSATPYRADGSGLDDIFPQLIPSPSLQTMINKRLLKNVKMVSAGGKPENVKELFQTYRRFADGKQGIVFAKNGRHANRIVEYYMQMGVESACIGFDTPAEEAEWLLNDYEKGAVKVLVNVDYFLDVDRCMVADFVQLAQPLDSVAAYLQQVECCMVIDEKSRENKQNLMVIDHVGASERFGLPTKKLDRVSSCQGAKDNRRKTGERRIWMPTM